MGKIFLGVIGQGVIKGLLPLIVVPIFISQWGEQDYSIWLQSMAIAAFLSLLGIGLNNFGINRCQVAFKQKKTSKYRVYDTLLSLNIVIYLFVTLISLIYVNIVDVFLNMDNKFLVYLFGFYNAATILFSYINLSFRIIEKYHITLYLSVIYNIFLYLGLIFFVYNQAELVEVAYWMIFAIHLSILINFLILFYYYNLRFKFRFSIKSFLPYIVRSYKVLYFQLGDYFRISLPIVFIGTTVSPIILVSYTVNRTLSNLLSQVYLVVHSTIMQKVTSNFAEGDLIKPGLIYKVVYFIMLPILCFAGLFLYELYEIIISVWIGERAENIANYEIITLLIISSFLYCIWNLGTIFLVATNNFSKLSKLSLIHGVSFFIFGLIGFNFLHLYGFIMGGIFAELIFGIIFINYEIYRYLSIRFYDLLKLLFYSVISIFSIVLPSIIFESAIHTLIISALATLLWIILTLIKHRNIISENTSIS